MTNSVKKWLQAHKSRTGLCVAVALSVIGSGRRLDISSSFCTDEDIKKASAFGVIEISSSVSCVHLSRLKEPFSQYVSKLLRGGNILDWDAKILVHPISAVC